MGDTHRKSRTLLRLLFAALALSAPHGAAADVLLRLERLNDTDVILSGIGSLGTSIPPENVHALFLQDPFAASPPAQSVTRILEESDLRAGSFQFNFANAAGPGISASFANTIYLGRDVGVLPFPQIPSNAPLSGSMFLRLSNGASFAPIDSTGQVFWGTTTGNIDGVLSGTWEMVSPSAVPEPGAAAMMLVGLALIGSLARQPPMVEDRTTTGLTERPPDRTGRHPETGGN